MIDSHLHVVDGASAGPNRTGHPDGAWWEQLDTSPAAVIARLDASGVDRAVFVQAVGPHAFDNSFVLAAAAADSRWRAVGAVGGDDPDPVATVEALAGSGASGVRFFSLPTPAVAWLDREPAIAAVHRCGELGLTPVVCCMPEELGAVGRLLAAVPEVEIALDHAGFVAIGGPDEAALARLARRDNLVAKVTTPVFDAAASDPAATVARLLDLFGPDRLVWGSDHPQIRDRDYPTLVELARRAVESLPDTTRAAVLGGTAARLWFGE